jgi:hypothetical protein
MVQISRRNCFLTLAFLLVLVLGCLALFGMVAADSATVRGNRARLDSAIKPGMTRDQVYQQVTAIGSYRVVYMQPRPDRCGPGPEKLYVELVAVNTSSRLPIWGSLDKYLCFDASGVLVEVFDSYL